MRDLPGDLADGIVPFWGVDESATERLLVLAEFNLLLSTALRLPDEENPSRFRAWARGLSMAVRGPVRGMLTGLGWRR